VTSQNLLLKSGKESNMSRIGNYVVELEENKIFCINCEQEVDLEELTDLDICQECYEQQTIDNQLFYEQ
jgi:Zn finger protein HypA/HybF involved in hydrogenase expression